MIRIVELKPLENYRLWVRFSDGLEGVYAVAPRERGGVFAQLCDRAVFEKAVVNEEFGCVEWPGGIDLCPSTMHDEMTGKLLKTVPVR